ncbi:hypothetical protein WJX79_000875 [Trebouxia sp. C0005]
MDVLRLASYTAPVSCAVLLPLFVAVECHTARREEVISAAKERSSENKKKILTVKMSIGISLAMLGFGMYSHTKNTKIQQQAELYEHGPQKFDQIPHTELDSGKGPLCETTGLTPLPSLLGIGKQLQGMLKKGQAAGSSTLPGSPPVTTTGLCQQQMMKWDH